MTSNDTPRKAEKGATRKSSRGGIETPTDNGNISQESPSQARQRRSQTIRNLEDKIAAAPSQAAFGNASGGTLIHHVCPGTKRFGNIQVPLKYTELAKHFEYQMCIFDNSQGYPSRICSQEFAKRKDPQSFLQDDGNQRCHISFNCDTIFHGRCKQPYYIHKNVTCKVLHPKGGSSQAELSPTNDIKNVEVFINRHLPCIAALANISTARFLAHTRSCTSYFVRKLLPMRY